MGENDLYGLPKLPTPILRVWVIRSASIIAAVWLCIVYKNTSDSPVVSIAAIVLAMLLVVVAVNQTLRERRVLRLARQSDLNVCARCCTPFEPDDLVRCSGCGRMISPSDEQRRWRRAVLVSLQMWFVRKPRLARVFPHWSIPLALLAYWILFFFLREPIEHLIWPPNSQTVQTLAIPNSGNPPRTYQMPVAAHPPMGYLIATTTIGLLCFLAIPIYIIIRQFVITKRLRLVAQRDFLVCEKCAYPLQNTDGDKCPECGQSYERERLRQRWYMTYGLYNPKQAVTMSIPLGPVAQSQPVDEP